MRRFENPAAFVPGIVLGGQRKTIAPLETVTDSLVKRLQPGHRITGKRIGGHLCIVATPK